VKAPRLFLPLLSSLLLSAALPAAPAHAHEFVGDQACTPTLVAFYSVRYFGPLAQGFVPALDVMDAAEFSIDWLSNGDTNLQVRVHRDSLGGEVVGVSDSVHVGWPAEGIVHFDFPTPVALQAGSPYVLEVVHLSGSGNPMLAAGDSRPYPDGHAYIQGKPTEGYDYWFRVGADQALPARATTWGAIKAAYR
jgi:hypothetical protein